MSLVSTDYKYEAFISYPRSPEITYFVKTYFYPKLSTSLAEELGQRDVQIFIDQKGITEGDHWPEGIREALLFSKCLVPVLSGSYFSRRWCHSEWSTFVERERSVGLDNSRQSLIVPVCYQDGEHFPEEAKGYQMFDFKKYATDSPKFKYHRKYPKFEKEVRKLAKVLANVVRRIPQFDPKWAIVDVDPESPPVQLKRIV